MHRDDENVKDETWLSLRDAAEQLDVHYMTAYRYVRTGALKADQRNGQWYVGVDDLTSFVSKRAETPRSVGRPARTAARQNVAMPPRCKAIKLADRMTAGDQVGSWHIIDEALDAGADIRQIDVGLLTPALQHIGDEWAAKRVSIGDEHRASVVGMRLIARLGARFTRPGRKRGTVLLSAVPGDRHGLPSAIMSDILRSEGFAVVDLGADPPGIEIVTMAADQDRLVGVGLCATTPLQRAAERELRDLFEALRSATGRPVLLGGSAVTDVLAARLEPDHRSGDADDAVTWFLDLAKAPLRVADGALP